MLPRVCAFSLPKAHREIEPNRGSSAKDATSTKGGGGGSRSFLLKNGFLGRSVGSDPGVLSVSPLCRESPAGRSRPHRKLSRIAGGTLLFLGSLGRYGTLV